MSHIIIGILGMVGSFFLLRYREQVGDLIGEADWMHAVGGVYNLVILLAIFFFFFSVAYLTGTTSLLLSPLRYLFPGSSYQASSSGLLN